MSKLFMQGTELFEFESMMQELPHHRNYTKEDKHIKKRYMRMLERLIAEGGYRYAQLDYEKEFALNEEGIPVPKAFGVKTAAASDLVDYSWFDSSKSEYTLTTVAQLEAFNVLCNGQNNYFAGKTVKLGADITLTGGSETVPNWTPIHFSGTFDGQGHTVSGVYVKSKAQGVLSRLP